MDDIWKNAAKKVRAREKRAASHITATSTTAVKSLPTVSPPTTPPPTAFDPETGTLEELEQTSQRLQWDWPKEDGIPFPVNILEMLRALRVAVIVQDTRKGLMGVQPIAHTASAICRNSHRNHIKKSHKKAMSL